jgi:hypothetical protein
MTHHPVVSGRFKTSCQVFKDALDAAKLEIGFPRWINAYFVKDRGGKKVYGDLKKIYEGAYERHKQYRKSLRYW